MNRKPHIEIFPSNSSHSVAVARFDVHGTGTTITHISEHLHVQRLELENSQAQLLRTSVRGNDHWWQPHPGNKGVLELTNEMEEIVARFTFAAPSFQRRVSVIERWKEKSVVERDLGELHVVDELAGGDMGREDILCSAVVVIERAKRRAMKISGVGLNVPAALGV